MLHSFKRLIISYSNLTRSINGQKNTITYKQIQLLIQALLLCFEVKTGCGISVDLRGKRESA
jgi:hypothetical protein